MKPGIVTIAELHGPVADRILEIQRRFDPRMAAELPPHITLTGSSGMGPIAFDTPIDALRAALDPVAAATTRFTVRFQPAHRFMQSKVVVLPLDPNGPIRALHEAIKLSGLPYDPPRFTFTPHCTLSFYPELTRDQLRELLAIRVSDDAVIDSFQVYRTVTLTRTENLLDFPLAPRL